MDNIVSPQTPPRAQQQSPPKTGGHGGSVGSGKKKERRKSGRKSESSDDVSASSPNPNSPQGQKEMTVIVDKKPENKDDQSNQTRQDSHVLQDKSNVEVSNYFHFLGSLNWDYISNIFLRGFFFFF